MPRTTDPVYVVSYFLRELEIYSGIDSIVIADNAAQTRTDARAVIIHMRSNFHKRGAMGILRRELARQKMADTAVRDCFLTATMEKVKRYIRFVMNLKTSGVVDKFQIVNRKGQPILQTGMRNGNYTDYQGVVEEDDQQGQGEQEREDGPWTTVGKKGKKIAATVVELPADRLRQKEDRTGQTAGAGALPTSWSQMTEKDFPKLPAVSKASDLTQQNKQRPTTSSDGHQKNKSSNNKQQQSKLSLSAASHSNASHTSSSKTRSNLASREASKNSSRQPSRERVSSNSDKHGARSRQGSRPSSLPPFRSYFAGRVCNTDEGPRAPQKKTASDNGKQAEHDQQHRKR
jgi:hypothetical protein